MDNSPSFLSAYDQKRVIEAITQAERQTSGEIRVFIEKNCPDDVLQRAAAVFDELEIHQTQEKNGVLFYLAYEDHKFAVIGDKGINERVPGDFWNSTKDHLLAQFRQGNFAEGFVQGILEAGEQLKLHFPISPNDTNELSNEIVFGK